MSIDRRRLIVSGLGAALGGAGLAGCVDDQPTRLASTGGQYGQGPYAPGQGQYGPGQYPQGQYAQGQYAQGQYAQGPYGQGGYGPPPGAGPAPAYNNAPPYDNPPASGYAPPAAGGGYGPGYGADPRAEPYSHDEIVHNVSDFFGVAAESAGGVVERVFGENGLPTGYIAGSEGSGAVGLGLRYGKGLLYMKRRPPMRLYWRGPSVGWDLGGNASRVFTLCYNLQYPEAMLQRFPGVDGSLYVVAGLGVNYQRANDITLAPIRSGIGLRAGANVGYLAYSRDAHIWPF